MEDCLFCKIAQKNIPVDFLYEDEQFLVFEDKYPKAPTHLLLIPKQHIDNLLTLEPEHKNLLGDLMLKIPEVAKAQGLEQGFRLQVNTGPAGGQEIYHIHFHILSQKARG